MNKNDKKAVAEIVGREPLSAYINTPKKKAPSNGDYNFQIICHNYKFHYVVVWRIL